MSAPAHQASSLGWQGHQILQRLAEWWEYQWRGVHWPSLDWPRWAWLDSLARGLFWLLVVTLALGGVWQLYRGGRVYWQRRSRVPTVAAAPSTAAGGLQQSHYWGRQAQALADQGDYAAACRALYLAGLARLNDTQAVAYRASRTDGEYLDCLLAQPSRPYAVLIRTHERLTFGRALATPATYQRCRQAYREITQS
ncbi:MAG TPA: DUF4129 domain-containing protein [Leptolyngbyaceae cyanobacterium M65_K2018_010]|nr:DUF4129 domain-containing protein [Leptolyngbyaceae cyanobacterium M65_K2018_010]